MKRILALLLCFCLCVSLIPAAFAEDPEDIIIVEEEYLDEGDELIEIIDPELPAGEVNAGLPAYGTCGGSLTWTLNEYGYLSIEGSGYMDDYDAENPAPWQDWANYVTDLSIGSEVRSIGSCAFFGLPNLEYVQFSYSGNLEEIGQAAFADCVSLDHLYLPDGLGVIPRYLCSGCSALNYVIFPASLTTVCYGAFEDCWRLDSAFLPDSLEEIEPYAFARSGISYVNIPDSVSEIGTEAFMDCWFLKSVVIGSGVEEIGSWVFMGCDELEQVVFRGSVPDFDTFDGREENFKEVTIKAYYPAENSSWTSAARRDYGGHITWKSYSNGLYIALQPLSQEVYVGHNAYLNFRIGCVGEAVYKWQYKTADALDGSWKTLSDAAPFDYYSLGASLDLYDLPLELNGACFRCKVTSGGSTVYTDTIWLTVKVGDWPYIIRQPESAVAEPGETAVFDLEAGGKDLTYEWQYSPSNNPGTWFKSSGSGADTPTYSVVAKTFRDGYQYRCRIYNLTDTVYSNEVSLTVMEKPAITTQPKSITAASGDTATFKVTATGSDLSYQWQYRTSSSGTWKNSSGTGSNKASYPVSAASYRDGYQYRCKVSNAAGTATSSAATLTVVSMLKPKITTQPKDITTLTGNTVTFKVAATGGSLSYQWYYLSGPDATWVKCSGGTGARLPVPLRGHERSRLGHLQGGDADRQQDRKAHHHQAAQLRFGHRRQTRDLQRHGYRHRLAELPVVLPQEQHRGLDQVHGRHRHELHGRGQNLPQRLSVPLRREELGRHDLFQRRHADCQADRKAHDHLSAGGCIWYDRHGCELHGLCHRPGNAKLPVVLPRDARQCLGQVQRGHGRHA